MGFSPGPFSFIIIQENLQSQKIIRLKVNGAETLNLGGNWQVIMPGEWSSRMMKNPYCC